MSLNFTVELLVMAMKKDSKLEEEPTCRFKIEMRTLMNFNRALENLKNLHFNGLPLTKVYNVLAKYSIEELYLMGLKIDETLDRKLTCAFKNDMRNSGNSHQNTGKSKNWDSFIQSRKCMSLKCIG